MTAFLFTLVNTWYGAGEMIYPDFASGFAAFFVSSCRYDITKNSYTRDQDICTKVQSKVK
jgi:hypothetical protein